MNQCEISDDVRLTVVEWLFDTPQVDNCLGLLSPRGNERHLTGVGLFDERPVHDNLLNVARY
jgi:hypothetical protein